MSIKMRYNGKVEVKSRLENWMSEEKEEVDLYTVHRTQYRKIFITKQSKTWHKDIQ